MSFAATAVGSYRATLTATDNASPATQDVSLTGTVTAAAIPQATLSPATLTYTATTGSTSATQTATLTNTGTGTLTISGITLAGANPTDFGIGSNTCDASLAAGATCSITVAFTPASAGSFSASLSVADNAAGSPQASSLTGTGTAPAAPDFTVAATPPPQSVVAGSTATYAVTVVSTGGTFAQAITLTASGLPPAATVSFTPASITPGGTGAQSTMIVQTVAQHAAAGNGPPLWPFTAPVLAAALLLFPGKRFRLGKKGWRLFTNLVCIIALLGLAVSTIGCGAGFALPSSAKTYTITVTGTSGSDTHSTTVTLTVQ